jgi:hypothetical protein
MRFSVRALFALTAVAALASWLVANDIFVREVLIVSLIAMACLAGYGAIRLSLVLRSWMAGTRDRR